MKNIVLLSSLLLSVSAIAGKFSWIVPEEINGFRMSIVQENDAPPTTWTAYTWKYVGEDSAVSVPASFWYQTSESEWWQIPVTEIGSSTFEGNETIISVAIPDSVTSIGAWAFQYCKNLVTCSFGNVKVIGPSAFNGCSSLENVGLNGVHTINSYAFWNCVSLPVELNLSAKYVDTGAFKGCSSITNLKLGVSLECLGDGAFEGCASLKKAVVLGNGNAIVCEHAFAECTSLEKCVLDGVSSIDTSLHDGPFYRCWNLQELSLGNSLLEIPSWLVSGLTNLKVCTFPVARSIGYRAFAGCSSLNDITSLHDVTTIADNAFENCTSLGNIIEASHIDLTSIESLGSCVFVGCKGIQSVVTGNRLSSAGHSIFSGCTNLREVEIDGNGEVRIRDNFFLNCSSLERCTIGDGVNGFNCGWWDAPFNGCTNLRELYLGIGTTNIPPRLVEGRDVLEKCSFFQGMESIGKYAFSGCTNLTEIGPLDKVRRIDNNAFANCKSLWCVLNLFQIEEIGDYAFDGCAEIDKVWTGFNLSLAGHSVFKGCTSLKDVEINGNGEVQIRDNFFLDCSSLERCVIGNGVNGFSCGYWDAPFKGCANLRELYLGSGTTNIPARLVEGRNKLEKCSFSQEMASIGTLAFSGCTILTEVRYLDKVRHIADSAFKGCVGLRGNIRLDHVESIGSCAFQDCNGISSVTILNTMPITLSQGVNTTTDIYKNTDPNLVTYVTSAWTGPTDRWQQRTVRMIGDANVNLGNSDVTIPGAWVAQHVNIYEMANCDVSDAIAMTAANGCQTVGECYALGIDPEDPDDDFKVTHFEMKDGKPVITLNHTEDGSGNSFLPRVKTLGKADLSDAEWREVPEEGDDTMRFFKVEVEMP